MKHIRAILLIAVFMSLSLQAQDVADASGLKPVRPVISNFMIDFGGASVLDTYLSPLTYHGKNLRLSYERLQPMKFNPGNWIMQMNTGAEYSPVQNPAGNRSIYSLMGDFSWGMMRRWRMPSAIQLFAGGSTSFRGGVLYAPSNSNNVVSVKLHGSLNATAMAVYNRKIGKLPVTFRYQATVPVAGVFFSPGYGESYYEIYMGNHSRLAHFGWWGNRFDMTNLLTADLHFGRTVLRLGYRGHIETSWVNNLNTHIFTNSAVVGVGGEWMTLRQDRKLDGKAKIISAMY